MSSLLQDDSGETALGHAASTGLISLSLFAPRQPVSGTRTSTRHLVEILRCCQSAEEDARILRAMIARLKDGVQAVAVALFAEERGQLTLVASEGARIERECAERVPRWATCSGLAPGQRAWRVVYRCATPIAWWA